MPLTPAARRLLPFLAAVTILVAPLAAAAKATITFMMWGDPGFMRYHDLVGAKLRLKCSTPTLKSALPRPVHRISMGLYAHRARRPRRSRRRADRL